MDFEVDITKPLISPPNMECGHDVFAGFIQTEESKKETESYKQYLREYGQALENKRHKNTGEQ